MSHSGHRHAFALARRDHLLRRRFDGENTLIDIDDSVDERDLGIQSRLGDDAHRLAEPHQQGLLGLIDSEEGAVRDDQRDQQYYGENAAGKLVASRRLLLLT
jgi:hypothetical protein